MEHAWSVTFTSHMLFAQLVVVLAHRALDLERRHKRRLSRSAHVDGTTGPAGGRQRLGVRARGASRESLLTLAWLCSGRPDW